jgi:hypothetical protein
VDLKIVAPPASWMSKVLTRLRDGIAALLSLHALHGVSLLRQKLQQRSQRCGWNPAC